MANTYTLTVVNDSELGNPDFAIFTSLPLVADYASLSCAWLVQQIDDNNTYTFTWDIQWGFAWSATGTNTGVQWAASGSLPADPLSQAECAATFGYNGDFQLLPATGTPDGQTLTITDSPQVPIPSDQPSSVGVTLGGSPACVTNAGPNLTQVYTLHPTYYIDAGQYVKGQMVDGTSLTRFQALEYAAGVYALTATIDADNNWSVEPSAGIDFSKRLRELHA
jgi:hypothetical protein